MANRDPQDSKSLHSSYSDILFGRISPCPPEQDPNDQDQNSTARDNVQRAEIENPIAGAIINVKKEKENDQLGRILVKVDTGQGQPSVVIQAEKLTPEHEFGQTEGEKRKTVRPYSRLSPVAGSDALRLRSSSADPPRGREKKESFGEDEDTLPSRPQSAIPPADHTVSPASNLKPNWDGSGKCPSYAEISFRHSQSDLFGEREVGVNTKRGQVETGVTLESDSMLRQGGFRSGESQRNLPRRDIFATMSDFRSEKPNERKTPRFGRLKSAKSFPDDDSGTWESKQSPENPKQSISVKMAVAKEAVPESGASGQAVVGFQHPTIPGLIFPDVEHQSAPTVPIAPPRRKRKARAKSQQKIVSPDFESEPVITRRDQLTGAPEVVQPTYKLEISRGKRREVTLRSESEEKVPQGYSDSSQNTGGNSNLLSSQDTCLTSSIVEPIEEGAANTETEQVFPEQKCESVILTDRPLSTESIPRLVPNIAESGVVVPSSDQPLENPHCKCNPNTTSAFETLDLDLQEVGVDDCREQLVKEIDSSDQLQVAKKFRPVVLSCPTTIEEIEQLEVLDCNEVSCIPQVEVITPKEQISEMSIVFSNPNSFQIVYPTPLNSASQTEGTRTEVGISDPSMSLDQTHEIVSPPEIVQTLEPESFSEEREIGNVDGGVTKSDTVSSAIVDSNQEVLSSLDVNPCKIEESIASANPPEPESSILAKCSDRMQVEVGDTTISKSEASELADKEILSTQFLDIDPIPCPELRKVESSESGTPAVESAERIDRTDLEADVGTHEISQSLSELDQTQPIVSSISLMTEENPVNNTPTTSKHENENKRDVSQLKSPDLVVQGVEGVEMAKEEQSIRNQVEKSQKTECTRSVRVTSPIVPELGEIIHMLSYADAEYRYRLYLAQKEIDDDKANAALAGTQPQETETNVIIKSIIDSLPSEILLPDKPITQSQGLSSCTDSESQISLSIQTEAEKGCQELMQENIFRQDSEGIVQEIRPFSTNLPEINQTNEKQKESQFASVKPSANFATQKEGSYVAKASSLSLSDLYPIPIFLLHTTELNIVERNWREKLAAEEFKKNQVSPSSPVNDSPKPPPPPPGEGDRNKKFDPKGNGRDDGIGRGGGTTRLQYTGLTGLMSNWLDWSTHLRADPLIPEKIDLTTENQPDYTQSAPLISSSEFIDYNPYSNYETTSPWDDEGLEHFRPDDCDNRNYLSEEYLLRIKSLLSGDTDTLQEEIDAQVRKIENLVNSQDALDATIKYKEILRSLKGLEPSVNSWKDILSSLPQDPEVKEITRDVIDLSMHLKALITQTGKLSKAAEFRATKLEEMTTQREPDIASKLESVFPTSVQSQSDVTTEGLDVPEADMDSTKSQISEPIQAVTIIPHELANAEVVFENIGGLECGRETVMNSLEITTTQIPEKQVVFESETGGRHVVTRMQRSGFVTQKREVSVVQSVHGLMPPDDGQESDSRVHSPTFEEPESEHVSDSIIVRDIRSASPIDRPDISEGTLSLELPGDISSRLAMVELPDESSSGLTVTVRQVTKHVTRRVIRKRRRIIRKIITVNGVEKITEEIIEEPDEVDEHTSEMTCAPMVDISGGYSSDLQYMSDSRPRSPGLSITEVSESSLGVATAEPKAELSGVETTDKLGEIHPVDSKESELLPDVTHSLAEIQEPKTSKLPDDVLPQDSQSKVLPKEPLPQAKSRKKKKGLPESESRETPEEIPEVSSESKLPKEVSGLPVPSLDPSNLALSKEAAESRAYACISESHISKVSEKATVASEGTEDQKVPETTKYDLKENVESSEIKPLGLRQDIPGSTTNVPAEELSPSPPEILEESDQAKSDVLQFPLEVETQDVPKEPLPQAKTRKKKKGKFGTEAKEPTTIIPDVVPADSELAKTLPPASDQDSLKPSVEVTEIITETPTAELTDLDLSTQLPDHSTITSAELKSEEETMPTAVELNDSVVKEGSGDIQPLVSPLNISRKEPSESERDSKSQDEKFSLDVQSKNLEKEPLPKAKSRQKKKRLSEATEPSIMIPAPSVSESSRETETSEEIPVADSSELDRRSEVRDTLEAVPISDPCHSEMSSEVRDSPMEIPIAEPSEYSWSSDGPPTPESHLPQQLEKQAIEKAETKDKIVEMTTAEEVKESLGELDEIKAPDSSQYVEVADTPSVEIPTSVTKGVDRMDQTKSLEESFTHDAESKDLEKEPLPKARSRKKKKGVSEEKKAATLVPAVVHGDSEVSKEKEMIVPLPISDPLSLDLSKEETKSSNLILKTEPLISQLSDQSSLEETKDQKVTLGAEADLKQIVAELKSDQVKPVDPREDAPISTSVLSEELHASKSQDEQIPLDAQSKVLVKEQLPKAKSRRKKKGLSGIESRESSIEIPTAVSRDSELPMEIAFSSADPSDLDRPGQVAEISTEVLISESAISQVPDASTGILEETEGQKVTIANLAEDDIKSDETKPLDSTQDISDEAPNVHGKELSPSLSEEARLAVQSEVVPTEPLPQAKSRKKRKGKKNNDQGVAKDLYSESSSLPLVGGIENITSPSISTEQTEEIADNHEIFEKSYKLKDTTTPEALPDFGKEKTESMAPPESVRSEKPTEEKITSVTETDEIKPLPVIESENKFPSVRDIAKEVLSHPHEVTTDSEPVESSRELIVIESEERKESSSKDQPITDFDKEYNLPSTSQNIPEVLPKDSDQEVTSDNVEIPNINNLGSGISPEIEAADREPQTPYQSDTTYSYSSVPSTFSLQISLSAVSFIPSDSSPPDLAKSDHTKESEPILENLPSERETKDELELKSEDVDITDISFDADKRTEFIPEPGSDFPEIEGEEQVPTITMQSSDKDEIELPVSSNSDLIPKSTTKPESVSTVQLGVDTNLPLNIAELPTQKESYETLPDSSPVGLIVQAENIADIPNKEFDSPSSDSFLQSNLPENQSISEILEGQEELTEQQAPDEKDKDRTTQRKKKHRKRKNDKEKTPPLQPESTVEGAVAQKFATTDTTDESFKVKEESIDIEAIPKPISEELPKSKPDVQFDTISDGKLDSTPSEIFPKTIDSENVTAVQLDPLVDSSAQVSPTQAQVKESDLEVVSVEESELRGLGPSSSSKISKNLDSIPRTGLPEDVSDDAEEQIKLSNLAKPDKSESLEFPESVIDDTMTDEQFHPDSSTGVESRISESLDTVQRPQLGDSTVGIEYLQPYISTISKTEEEQYSESKLVETTSPNIIESESYEETTEQRISPSDIERHSTKALKRVSFSEVPDTIIIASAKEDTPDSMTTSDDLEGTESLSMMPSEPRLVEQTHEIGCVQLPEKPSEIVPSDYVLNPKTESSEIQPKESDPTDESAWDILKSEEVTGFRQVDSEASGFADDFVQFLPDIQGDISAHIDESIVSTESSQDENKKPFSSQMILTEEPELIPADQMMPENEPDLTICARSEELLPKSSGDMSLPFVPSTSENITFQTDAERQQMDAKLVPEGSESQEDPCRALTMEEDQVDKIYTELEIEEKRTSSPLGLIDKPENIAGIPSEEYGHPSTDILLQPNLAESQPVVEMSEVQEELAEEESSQPSTKDSAAKRKRKHRKRKNDKERTPPIQSESSALDAARPGALASDESAKVEEELADTYPERSPDEISFIRDSHLISEELRQPQEKSFVDQEIGSLAPPVTVSYQTTEKSMENIVEVLDSSSYPEHLSKKGQVEELKKLDDRSRSELPHSQLTEETLIKESVENKKPQDISSLVEQSEGVVPAVDLGESDEHQKLIGVLYPSSSLFTQNVETVDMDFHRRSSLDESEKSEAGTSAESFAESPESVDKKFYSSDQTSSSPERALPPPDQTVMIAKKPEIVTKVHSGLPGETEIFPETGSEFDSKTTPETAIETRKTIEPEVVVSRSDEAGLETPVFLEHGYEAKPLHEATIEANVRSETKIETKTVHEEEFEMTAHPEAVVETEMLFDAEIKPGIDPEPELETNLKLETKITTEMRAHPEMESEMFSQTEVQMKALPKAQIKTKVFPGTDTQTTMSSGADSNEKLVPETEVRHPETQRGMQTEANFEVRTVPKATIKAKIPTPAEIEARMDSGVQTEPTGEAEDEVGTKIQPETKKEVKVHKKAKTKAKKHLKHEMEIEGQPDATIETKIQPTTEVDAEISPEASTEEKVPIPGEIETKMKGEGETERKTKAETKMQSGVEAESKMQSEVEAETKIQHYADAEAKIQPEVEVEAKTQSGIEAETKIQHYADAEAKIQPEVEVEAKTQSGIETETKVQQLADDEVKIQPEVEVEAKTQSGIETETKVQQLADDEVKIQPEVEVETKTQSGDEAETKIQQQADVEAKIQPEVEVETKPQSGVKAEMKIQHEVDTESKIQPESEVVPKVYPKPKIDSKIRTETTTETQTADIEKKMQPETEIKTKIHPDTDVDTNIQPEVKAQTAVEAEAGIKIQSELEADKIPAELKAYTKLQSKLQPKPKLQPDNMAAAIGQGEVQTETTTESEIKTETKIQPIVAAETKVQSEVETETKISPEAGTEMKIRAEIKAETKIQPDVSTEMKIQMAVETETIAQSEGEAEMKLQAKSEAETKMQPGIEAETIDQSEVQTVSKMQPDVGTELQLQAELEIETRIPPEDENVKKIQSQVDDTKSQPEVETEGIIKSQAKTVNKIQPEAQTVKNMEPEVEPETIKQLGVETTTIKQVEVETEMKREPEVEIKTQIQPVVETKTQMQPVVETKTQIQPVVETKTQMQPVVETKTEMKGVVEAETKIQPEVGAEMNLQTKSDAKTKIQSDIEAERIEQPEVQAVPKVQPDVETTKRHPVVETETKIQTEVGPEITMQADVEAETKMQPKAVMKTKIHSKPEIETKIDAGSETEMQILTTPNIENKTQLDAKVKTIMQPDTDIDTKIHPERFLAQIETEMKPEVHQLEAEIDLKPEPHTDKGEAAVFDGAQHEMKMPPEHEQPTPSEDKHYQKIHESAIEVEVPIEAKDESKVIETALETKLPSESDIDSMTLRETEIGVMTIPDETATLPDLRVEEPELEGLPQELLDDNYELAVTTSDLAPTILPSGPILSTGNEIEPISQLDIESQLSSTETTGEDALVATSQKFALPAMLGSTVDSHSMPVHTDYAQADLEFLNEAVRDDVSPKLETEAASILSISDSPDLANQNAQIILDKLIGLKRLHLSREKPITIPRLANYEDLSSKTNDVLDHISISCSDLTRQDSNTVDAIDFIDSTCNILDKIATAMGTMKNQLQVLEQSTIPIETKKIEQEMLSEQMLKLNEEFGKIKEYYQSVDSLDEDFKEELDNVLRITENDLAKLQQAIEESIGDTETIQNNLDAVSEELNKSIAKLDGIEKLLLENANDPDLSTDLRLSHLDNIQEQFNDAKLILEKEIAEASELMTTNPSTELVEKIQKAKDTIQRLDQLILSENARITQDVSLSEEYEQTLKDFSQVIEVAETILNGKLHVQNLEHLHGELDKHRTFFGNFKKCQLTLEKLENDLDDATKESHQNLHQTLYEKASAILDRAARRRQQMAVSTARWSRLEQGLQDERAWLSTLANKIPNINAVSSSDLERYCGLYQSFYSDIIVHQARLLQLRTISESLSEVVECSELKGVCDDPIDNLLTISGNITASLQSLIGFRDTFSNYERHLHRLKAWLQRAEARMDAVALQTESHPYEFWELKAQLESQQPLRNEAFLLLNQSLKILSVTDEDTIREVFENFDERWLALSSSITQAENSMHYSDPSYTPSLETIFTEVETDITEMQAEIENMTVVVESEDDFYVYLEKLQILKAQILNKQHQLNSLLPKEGEEEDFNIEHFERIGSYLSTLGQIEGRINEELETSHIIREQFAKFNRTSLKIKRAQDTLRARVDQWASFFELSQDILKQAVENYQRIDDDITNTRVDLEKAHDVLQNFPSTPHISISTAKLENELREMDAVIHTLSARIQDLRIRVQEQLGIWQDYEHALSTALQLVYHNQSTLQLLLSEPPPSVQALIASQHYLKRVEEVLGDKTCLNSLQLIADKLKSDSPEEVTRQIDKSVQNVVLEWEEAGNKLSQAKVRYSTGKEIWDRVLPLQNKLDDWIDEFYPLVELGADESVLRKLQEELPAYESIMNELQALSTELCTTLFSSPENATSSNSSDRFPLTLELRILQKKIEFMRTCVSCPIARSTADLVDESRRMLDNVSKVLKSEDKSLLSPTRLGEIQQQLINIGYTEGRLLAAQASPSCNDSEVSELLDSSKTVFQETFTEYLKMWTSMSEKNETIELYKLWQNYVDEIEKYLSEPLPTTREQLVEDSSLCSVYHSILNGQYEPLSLAMEKQTLNFESLQNLHAKVEEKLKERQVQLKDRLNRWKTFEKCQESFSSWLRVMEREKRALELSFLQLSRLPMTLRKIEDLVGKCARGEELLEDFKKATTELAETCPPTLKLSLIHDLSSHSSMFSNLQAALKTWLDHVARINCANETFKLKEEEIQLSLDNIRQRLLGHVIPSTFTELSDLVTKIKRLQEEVNSIPLDELQSCLDSMNAAISPADTRILSQKIWYFRQQQVELLTLLGQDLSNAQERLDLLPRYDTKCKRWMVWVDAMQEKVEFPLTQNLESYANWIDNDVQSELQPKEEEFQWLIETGNELAEFTKGKELKEFVKALEAARSKWEGLNSTVGQRSKQSNHLIQTLNNLNERIEIQLKKLRTFENFITSPILLHDWNPEFINDAVRALDNEERKLKSEGTEIHQILTLTELVAADCEGLRFHQDAASARRSLDSLQDRWNDLLVRFDQRKQFLYLLRDDIRKIHDGCDYLETLLSQVDCDITSLENDDESSGTDEEQGTSQIEGLLASLEALSPKVQELNKEYGFAARKVTSLNSSLQRRLKRIKMDLNNLKKRGEDCRRKRRRMSVVAQFTSSYEFNRQFMDSIAQKLHSLSNLEDAEQLRSELKHLKQKCRENRQHEESMKLLVNSVTAVDPSIRAQIASQMNSYNALKKELEKLFKSSVKDLVKGKSTGPQRASANNDASVQVSTLPFERDFDTQVETLLLDESNNLFGETDSELNLLTRSDIYLQEFNKSVHDLQGRLEALRNLLPQDEEVNEIENGHLIEVLALAQTSMDTAQHLFRLLENEKLPQDRNATASLLAEMGKTLEGYELDIRRLSERTVEMSALKRLTCPVCSPSQRGVWDSTLWRLEQWLQYADATLTNIMRRHPPNDLEHLEDCVLSHRELLLDMDSHRSLVHSLSEVLDHLNGHEENTKISSVELHERLDRTLRWWKDICHRAAAWQARLQMALIENSDFHSTIRQFEVFISSVQEAITELEPVDLSEQHQTRVKLRSFQELSDRLLKAEPELKTLQQSAEQLFVNAASIEKDGLFRASRGSIESIFTTPECSLVLQRVGTLDRELNSLLRVSEAYVKHLSAFIAQNPDGNFDESLEPSKRVLRLPDTVVCNPQQSTSHKDEDLNKSHKSYLVRGSRFVYRVVRASLPIQALMILLLGASSLLPYGEEDYSCATANSFARSFEPMLRYPNGPPPI